MESRQQRYYRRKRKYKDLASETSQGSSSLFDAQRPSSSNEDDAIVTETTSTVDNDSDIPTFDRSFDHDNNQPSLSDSSSSSQESFGDDMELPIYENSTVTIRESAFAILSFVRKYKLSAKVINGILSLIRFHLPISNKFSTSRYLFEKVISQSSERMNSVRHYYCNNCSRPSETSGLCGVCETDFHYFIEFPLSDQLTKILRQFETSTFKNDVMSGQCYKSMMPSAAPIETSEISLQLNIDSAPMFTTSVKSFTPALLTVNEIGHMNRCRNIIIGGIWFGDKCNVDLFLHGLMPQWKDIETNGFVWRDINDVQHLTKVSIILCTVDAPMRASLQNIKQFNGHFGCGVCEHPGSVEKGIIVYDYLDSIPLRTSYETNIICDNFDHLTPDDRKGIKGLSPLSRLGRFDIIRSCPPDYLHAVLLGVMKKLLKMWIRTSFHRKPWYIGNQLNAFDAALMEMTPNNDIKRCPRTIKDLDFWRASEFKHFLLFWGPVILRKFLKDDFYNHFMLLSSGIYRLLKEDITSRDLEAATSALTSFSIYTESLYGKEFATYNNHQILHLPLSVRDWGPLWSWSTAPFESFLYYLKSSAHGSRGILLQLSRIISDFTLLKEEDNAKYSHKSKKHVSGAICIGPFETKASSSDSIEHSFHRLMWRHSLFLSKAGNKSKKRISYVSEVESTTDEALFGEIHSYFVRSPISCSKLPCMEHGTLFAQFKPFRHVRPVCFQTGGSLILANEREFPHVFHIAGLKNIANVPVENLLRLCVVAKCGNETYIVRQPNTLDKDM